MRNHIENREKCQRQNYDETTIDLKLNRTLTLCKWHWWTEWLFIALYTAPNTSDRIASHRVYEDCLLVSASHNSLTTCHIALLAHSIYVRVSLHKLQKSGFWHLLLIKFTQFELISVYAFRSWLIYILWQGRNCVVPPRYDKIFVISFSV